MNLILRSFLFLFFFVFGAGVLRAQTTWTGTLSTDWNTTANWSDGVPLATSSVFIPDVTNDPVISTTTAVAFTVELQNGALLTIAAAGGLTINTNANQAIWNWGTVTNNGTITIGHSAAGPANFGINNEAVFNNNAGATINIDSIAVSAILNSSTMNNR